MTLEEQAYIGFKSCGCAVAAMVAGHDSVSGERAELKRWVRWGYEIKVMTPDEARTQQGFLKCIHRVEGHEPTGADNLDALIKQARDPEPKQEGQTCAGCGEQVAEVGLIGRVWPGDTGPHYRQFGECCYERFSKDPTGGDQK